MTATRKPRARPERTLRLMDIEGNLVLQITTRQGKQAECKYYHLTPLPSDFGRAFRLEKSEVCGGGGYDVLVDGEHSSCECAGWLRWQHCRHIDALKTLRDLGRI